MISAIVLAAGQSKRMISGNKLIKKYNKKNLINHILETLIKSKIDKNICNIRFSKFKSKENIKKKQKNYICFK